MPHLNLEANHTLEEIPIEKIHLLGDRILCRIVTKSSQTASGLYIQHWEYAVKTQIGRILLLGSDYSGDLQPGEYVIFSAWSGREFRSPDETLILLNEEHIEARIFTND